MYDGNRERLKTWEDNIKFHIRGWYNEGHADGWGEGYEDGYAAGFNDAVKRFKDFTEQEDFRYEKDDMPTPAPAPAAPVPATPVSPNSKPSKSMTFSEAVVEMKFGKTVRRPDHVPVTLHNGHFWCGRPNSENEEAGYSWSQCELSYNDVNADDWTVADEIAADVPMK